MLGCLGETLSNPCRSGRLRPSVSIPSRWIAITADRVGSLRFSVIGDFGPKRLFQIRAEGPNNVPRHACNGNICRPVQLGAAVSVLISAVVLMADLRKGTYDV